ncbi:MAG: winged helix-turn-helix domain-containing protein, partial [Gammaproteobacteria bacterium]
RTMLVLKGLAERAGEVVSRDELLRIGWQRKFVSEGSLNAAIYELRRLFDDNPRDPSFIQTAPKIGYRLVANVRPAISTTSSGLRGGNVEKFPQPTESRSVRRLQAYLPWTVIAIIGFAAGAILLNRIAPLEQRPILESPPIPLTSHPNLEFGPAFSPDGTRMAYVWQGPNNDNFDIYIKSIGTATPYNLTNKPGYNTSASWSPDGTAIAYMYSNFHTQECGVYIRKLDSSDTRKVAPCNLHINSSVTWSPAGNYIAYTNKTGFDVPAQVYLISLDDLTVRPLTNPPSHYFGDIFPEFSPDGQSVLFVRGEIDGTRRGFQYSPTLGDLYTVSAQTGEERRLTFDAQELPGATWSPDGKRIVFASNRELGKFNLWELDAIGGAPRWLLGTDGMVSHPVFSKRGLAFVNIHDDFNIWRLELDGSQLETISQSKIITSTQNEISPQISPDGNRVAFATARSGHMEIWVSDLDGRNLLQVTDLESPGTDKPSWSPDSREIAFETKVDGKSRIYIINANGGEPRLVSSRNSVGSTHHDIEPHWSAEGNWIYFSSNNGGSWQIWKSASYGSPVMKITENGGVAAKQVVDAAGREFIYFVRLNKNGLWRLDTESGEEQLVYADQNPNNWTNWLLRGNDFYRFKWRGWDMGDFEKIDLSTGEVHKLASVKSYNNIKIAGLSLSPDGRNLLYSMADTRSGDIMLVENYQ